MPFYDYPLIRSRIDDCVYCSTRRFRRASTNEPNFYNPSDFVDRLAVSTPRAQPPRATTRNREKATRSPREPARENDTPNHQTGLTIT